MITDTGKNSVLKFMILTVTLNPLLERKIIYKKIILGENHRNGSNEFKAGGKGINVSRQLNCFGIDNLALTFLGGTNGKILNDVIHNEKTKIASVRTKSETRSAYIVIDSTEETLTTFFEASPEINASEADEFLLKLEKMIPNCDMVVFSGSSPSNNTNHIFPEAIKIANKLDKISICDTYGGHLKDCINAQPTILHNNISEIQSSLGLDLSLEQDKLNFLDSLYSKNIKQAFLTEGADPFYCSNFDYHFKVNIPHVKTLDPTGSGDALVAGIIYAWRNSCTFEESLSFAVSCGALNASTFETCRVNLNEIEILKKDIVISPVGKKMKLIDVTPH
ncbi:MAG: PfkB family carbohydrate kinase [Ignavibacteriaceae bacterium]